MNSFSTRLARVLALVLVAALLAVPMPAVRAQGPVADAQVVTSYLNMRAAPSASAALVQQISYGTLLGADGRNSDGSWLFVHTGAGVQGWVKTSWVALRLDLDINALPVTDAGGSAPAQQVVAPSTAAQSAAVPAQMSGTVVTIVTRVNIRTGPGTQNRRLGTLGVGVQLGMQGRDAGGIWVYGTTNTGLTGWVAAQYTSANLATVGGLPVMDASAPTGGSAAPVAAPAQTAAQPAAAPVQMSGTVATVLTRVNIRTGPGTQYGRLGTLGVGVQLGMQGRDASGIWIYGTTNTGLTGWVAAQYTTANPAGLPVMDASAPAGGSAAPAAPASAPVAAPAANPIPTGSFMLGGQVGDFSQQGWMQAAGMTWVKRQVVYGNGANPNDQAGLIADAHARGFRILLSVKGHPGDLASDPNYINNFAGYLGGLAGLGADAIEVWNEMNLDREWPAGRIDPNWYTQMLAAAYNAIKGRNGGTMVISGAPSPTGAEGAFGLDRVWNDDRYVRGMAAAGAARYMDCIGVHYNEGIIPPGQRSGDPRDGYFTRYFWGMVDTYWGAFGGQRPLCFTELGYLSPEGYGALPGGFAWAANVTVAQQAQWLADAARLSRSSGKVRMMIVWNVDFTGRWGDDPMGGYAIVRPNGDCPACRALGGIW